MHWLDRHMAQDTFDCYVNRFDVSDEKVRLKIAHTGRVCSLCERIAGSLELTDEEKDLAWLLGLLHDVGRFGQLKEYGTFNDALSVDHAKCGADFLFAEGHIRDYVKEDRYDALLETAIRNHNVFRLPSGLSEKELMFCRILRDADKIDILRVNIETPVEEIYNCTRRDVEEASVTEAVFASFVEKHAVEHRLKKTSIDRVVGHASLVFELEYPISVHIVKEQGYLDELLHFPTRNPETAACFAKMADILHEWMEERLRRDGNC